MAIYHMSIKIGSRSKGQSAVAAAAYRSGEKLTDHKTGIISDYTQKGGIVFSEISLCKNAPDAYTDRETLWNAVHQIEKNKSAQLWREFEVALPQELNREQQIETVRAFVKQLTEQGMCVDWSLHDKEDGNPHAHIMATMRSITENGEWAAKSRKVYDLDEEGKRIFQKIDKSGRKQYKSHKEDYNNWNAAERVEEWRSAWADCCNHYLTEKDKIDHRSYERQGVDQIPTIHEGYIARQLAARGVQSDRIAINEDIRKHNSLLQRIASQLKAFKEELFRLIELRNAAEVNNEVILSKYESINKLADIKPRVQIPVSKTKIETIESQKQPPVTAKAADSSDKGNVKPKSENKVIEQEIQRLIILRNNSICQGAVVRWLELNPIRHEKQSDLNKAKEIEEKFEVSVSNYFKASNNVRLHRSQSTSMQQVSAEKQLDAAATKLQKYFGFMLYPCLSWDNIRNQIDRLRECIKRNMKKKQTAANIEIEKNNKIEALTAMHITDETVKQTFGIYKKACVEMPENLRQNAINAIYGIKIPDPIGKFWDSDSLRFYNKIKKLVCETAEKYMSVSADLKYKEQNNEDNMGYSMGRIR